MDGVWTIRRMSRDASLITIAWGEGAEERTSDVSSGEHGETLAQSAEGIHPTSGKRYSPKPISDIANGLEAKALFGAVTGSSLWGNMCSWSEQYLVYGAFFDGDQVHKASVSHMAGR